MTTSKEDYLVAVLKGNARKPAISAGGKLQSNPNNTIKMRDMTYEEWARAEMRKTTFSDTIKSLLNKGGAE